MKAVQRELDQFSGYLLKGGEECLDIDSLNMFLFESLTSLGAGNPFIPENSAVGAFM